MAARTGYPQHVSALMGSPAPCCPASPSSGILLEMGGQSGGTVRRCCHHLHRARHRCGVRCVLHSADAAGLNRRRTVGDGVDQGSAPTGPSRWCTSPECCLPSSRRVAVVAAAGATTAGSTVAALLSTARGAARGVVAVVADPARPVHHRYRHRRSHRRDRPSLITGERRVIDTDRGELISTGMIAQRSGR